MNAEELRRRREVAMQKARPTILKLLEKNMETMADALEDAAMDCLVDAGFDPVDEEDGDNGPSREALDEWMGLVQSVVDETTKFWHQSEASPVWVLLSYDRDNGTRGLEVEIFGKRPRTWEGGDENWAQWFRVYEGNINGGDSVLGDARGANFG
jgi:hypothetical protein